VKIVQVNYAYAAQLSDHAALLDTYETLTGWSEAVARAGAEVSVVQAFHYDARLSRNGIEYVFCATEGPGSGSSRRWRRPRALGAAVLAARPDVIHVNSLEFAPEIWLLRRALPTDVALVVQDHANPVPRSFSLKGAVRRRLLAAADAFLFTAPEQSVPWRANGYISEQQRVYTVLESSTRLRPMDRETARSITRTEGRPAVLWVGRLNMGKDPITVLQGFERALEFLPDAVLTMVYGDDELLPAVRRRVNESASLSRSVRLVGLVPHDQMAAFYSAADLFVLGSAHEALGYSLIEACACGVVPVVTDIPSFRVITDQGAVGELWPQGDPSAFAAALVNAARRDLSDERRRVVQHFDRQLSWPVVGTNALAIYRDVHAVRRSTLAVEQ
jgi:glycosyltransferase involved in cell wall biosynthesis